MITSTSRTDIKRRDCIRESTEDTSGDNPPRQYKYGNFSNNGLLFVNLSAG